MNPVNNFRLIEKKALIILVISVVLAIILIFIAISLIFRTSNTQNNGSSGGSPTITPVTLSPGQSHGSIISPLQKTVINQTSADQILASQTVLKKEPLPNNETKYTVKSVNPVYPNEIITKNNVVIFEKTSTQTSQTNGYPSIKQYLEALGKPEEIIRGNAAFAAVWLESFLYPSKGIVIIGNPNTDRVYEIQQFPPMSLDEYKKLYGNYVKPVEELGV